MKNVLAVFGQKQKDLLSQKEQIIERLIKEGLVTIPEGIILLKTLDIHITADKLEMSSGAKIVGGSDFESNDYGR